MLHVAIIEQKDQTKEVSLSHRTTGVFRALEYIAPQHCICPEFIFDSNGAHSARIPFESLRF